jgi:hypothetical protein
LKTFLTTALLLFFCFFSFDPIVVLPRGAPLLLKAGMAINVY